MSQKMKMKRRKGTIDEGKMYEYEVAALSALKLLINKNVIDFTLSTNLTEMGAFDDLILSLTTTDSKKIYFAKQLKQKLNDNKVLPLNVKDDKGDFALKKYYNDYQNLDSNIQENFHFILYTNIKFDKNKNLDGMEILEKSCPLNDYLDFVNGHPYGFSVENDVKYSEFLSKFYLYPFQLSRKEVEATIEKFFEDVFGSHNRTYFKDIFIEYFRKWHLGNFQQTELTKKLIYIKFFDLLEEFMIVPKIIKNDYNNVGLIQDILSKFQLSNIERSLDNWEIILSEDDETIRKYAKKLNLLQNNCKNKNITNKIKAKVASFHYGLPFLIEVNDKNKQIIDMIINLLIMQNLFPVVLIGKYDISNKNIQSFNNLNQLAIIDQNLFSQISEHFTVSLQGRSLRFKELFEANEDLKSIFSINEIIAANLNGVCSIGEAPEELPLSYIPRHLPVKTIDLNFLKFSEENIIINCNTYFDDIQKKLNKMNVKYTNLKNVSVESCNLEKVILTSESTPISVKYSKEMNGNIHYFTAMDSTNLKWSWTEGDFIPRKSYFKTSWISETDIFSKIHDRINVICAIPGMGKSVLLNYLKNNTPPDYWTIKINCTSIINILEESEIEPEKIITYYRNTVLENSNEITKKVFKTYLDKKKIILFWDGLDELILNNLINNCLEYIKKIKNIGWTQWICSRTHLSSIIQNNLKTASINIRELNKREQLYYIEKRLVNRAKHEISAVSQWIFTNFNLFANQDILGVPLQLYMLTEVCMDKPVEFLNEFRTLSTIYEKFFELKSNLNITMTKNDFNNFLYKYQVVALISLIKSEHLKQCLDKDLFDILNDDYIEFLKEFENGDRKGIIINCDPSKKLIEFKHISYGEYCVASWMAKNWKRNFIKKFQNFIFNDNYRNIRFLFDLILAENNKRLVNILYGDIPDNFDRNVVDKAGRTEEHFICSWGIYHPKINYSAKKIKNKLFILYNLHNKLNRRKIKNDVKKGKLLVNSTMEPDNLFEWTPIDYAIKSRSWAILEGIASKKYLKTLDDFDDIFVILYLSFLYGYDSLAVGIFAKVSPFSTYYITGDFRYPFYYQAFVHNNFRLLKRIFEFFDGISDNYLIPALMTSLYYKNEFSGFLLQKLLKKNLINKDQLDNILDCASRNNNKGIIKYVNKILNVE